MSFSPGDFVQLKSGGPKMKVVRIVGENEERTITAKQDDVIRLKGYEDGSLVCRWQVDDTKKQTRPFKASMLKAFED